MTKKNNKLIIIILVIMLILAAIATAVFFLIRNKKLNLNAEDSMLGLEWGMSKTQIEETMENQGYQKHNVTREIESALFYTIDDYQGNKGVDGYIALLLDDSYKLTDIVYYFKSTEIDGKCKEKVIDSLYESYTELLDQTYTETSLCIYDSEYWFNENEFVTIIYKESSAITISFTDNNSDPEMVEYIQKFQ